MKNRSSGLPKGVKNSQNNTHSSTPLDKYKSTPLFDRVKNLNEALYMINPNFDDKWLSVGLPESEKKLYNKYGKNCALVTTAAALQMMGYDVEAMPRDRTWRGFDSVFDYEWTPENFVSPSDSYVNYAGVPWEKEYHNTNRFRGSNADSIREQIKSQMAKWGEGSFAALQVSWKGKGAHIFTVRQDAKGTTFIDFQIHKSYTPEQWFAAHPKAKPESIGLYRLDNQKIKSNIPDLDKIVKKRGK